MKTKTHNRIPPAIRGPALALLLAIILAMAAATATAQSLDCPLEDQIFLPAGTQFYYDNTYQEYAYAGQVKEGEEGYFCAGSNNNTVFYQGMLLYILDSTDPANSGEPFFPSAEPQSRTFQPNPVSSYSAPTLPTGITRLMLLALVGVPLLAPLVEVWKEKRYPILVTFAFCLATSIGGALLQRNHLEDPRLALGGFSIPLPAENDSFAFIGFLLSSAGFIGSLFWLSSASKEAKRERVVSKTDAPDGTIILNKTQDTLRSERSLVSLALALHLALTLWQGVWYGVEFGQIVWPYQVTFSTVLYAIPFLDLVGAILIQKGEVSGEWKKHNTRKDQHLDMIGWAIILTLGTFAYIIFPLPALFGASSIFGGSLLAVKWITGKWAWNSGPLDSLIFFNYVILLFLAFDVLSVISKSWWIAF